MTFDIKSLIDRGECEYIDFKIECNAFNKESDQNEKAKAELIKDIIAMANNDNQESYLIIGVSDDRQSFKTVTNLNLTSRNLQNLCSTSITPYPTVKVNDVDYEGNDLKVIKTGPNSEKAFAFRRNLIDIRNPNEDLRYYFRENEIWIRRGECSGLATPDEIAALVNKSNPALKLAQEAMEKLEAIERIRSEELRKKGGGTLSGASGFSIQLDLNKHSPYKIIFNALKTSKEPQGLSLRVSSEVNAIVSNANGTFSWRNGSQKSDSLLIGSTLSTNNFHSYGEVLIYPDKNQFSGSYKIRKGHLEESSAFSYALNGAGTMLELEIQPLWGGTMTGKFQIVDLD